ncbi:TOMM precursor leader peptide-binding protein [Actinomadura oligospora]|uniref:TOMM precursor leader peptide-binding protein n=1 Tax=Actinomadura oligospora TaxID=111804 RepID=UPI0004B5C1D9|nr:TOMM precursor leader peptide-binding protein [Actinomadura oligospora]
MLDGLISGPAADPDDDRTGDLLGSGTLHAALRRMPVPPQLRVVVTDGDDTVPHKAARADGVPWLPVRLESGVILIGPAVEPQRPGCPTCLSRRRNGNLPQAAARRDLRERLQDGRRRGGLPLLPLVTELVTALVRGELESGFARTRNGVLRVSAATSAFTHHRLLPDPSCPDCATPSQERPSRLMAEPAPKPDPARLRTGELDESLEEIYADAETGLISSVGVYDSGPIPWAVARRGPTGEGDDSRHGYGRTRDARSASLTAVAEALERHAGSHLCGRSTVKAAYADIADHALDPRTLGLYPDPWYDQPGFHYNRFDPDQLASWVWGYSFATSRPLLVPATYAYYGARTRAEPGWVYECSNGAALGSRLSEAILYGLLEVAERDAFLMTWYGRLPVPKVDLDSVADRRIPLTVAQIRQTLGYEVMAFAMPMEQGVPAFWVMAVDRSGEGGRPHALCGAGAHPNPEQALHSALMELFVFVQGAADPGRDSAKDPARDDRLQAMLDDPDQVRDMPDHHTLYGHPDAWPRLDFLPVDAPGWPLAELVEPWPVHRDLNDDLSELVGRYLSTGLNVIAVDTTCPDLKAGGLASAKVIVPGAASMTFGHRYRRVHALPRLLSVPRLLGYRDRDLRPDELNPFPHPFP